MSTTNTSNPSTSTSGLGQRRRPQEDETNGGDGGAGSFVSESHLNKTRQIFHQFRRNGVDVDVHLVCRSRSANGYTMSVIPCHKIFLRTCPYFIPLLEGPQRLNNNDKILKIDVDLDEDILEEIIRYLYTGEIKINTKNMVQLFETSLKLKLNELMPKFSKFQIGPLINKANWLMLLRIFNSTAAGGKFMKEIFAFLREKSSELSSWSSFLQLTFHEIRLILNAESRIFKSAKDFQAALLKWMTHDANSKDHLIEELSSFSFVVLPDVINLSETEDKSNKDGAEHDSDSESEQTSRNDDLSSDSGVPEAQPLAKRSRLSLRCPPSQSPAESLIFTAGDYFYSYSFQKKTTRKLACLPALDLRGFSMVLANERLFMMCGYDRTTASYSNKVYSSPVAKLLTNKKVTWKDESPLLEMANFSTTFMSGNIYTIGGIYNDEEKNIFHKPLRHSYELSLRANQRAEWNKVFKIKLSRSQCAAARLDNMLYIIGGIWFYRNLPAGVNMWGRGPERFKIGFEEIALGSVEVFNITSKKGTTLNSLRLARFDHQALAFQDKIFVMGGKVLKSELTGIGIKYKFTDSVEIFDPITKVWTDGPSLTVPRANFAAFVKDDKIFILGGNINKILGKPTMEVYDPQKNKWKLVQCGDFPIKTNFPQMLLIK